MEQLADRPTPSATAMAAFELSLALTAVALSWSVGHSPWIGMRWTSETLGDQLTAIVLGVVAAGPILLVMGAAYRWPVGPLRSLRRLTRRQLLPLFARLSLAEKAAVSLAAGLGEELLFRGLLQSALSDWIGGEAGPWIGLAVASVGFGVCHWLSRTYAILATCMGAYFGLLLIWTGNLWTPIFAHAAYDLMALVVLTRAGVRTPRQGETA